MEYKRFSLSDKFIDGYKRKKAPFGFNGLGELVYMRTYSRIKEDGKNEMWYETCQRVVEGTYNHLAEVCGQWVLPSRKNEVYTPPLTIVPLYQLQI